MANSIRIYILVDSEFHFVQCAVPRRPQPVYESEGNITVSPRIVGGITAQEGDVRGIVSIQTIKGNHCCGGTWIRFGNRSQILTAAHCIFVDDQLIPESFLHLLQIMGDDLSISKSSPGPRRQIGKVRKIVPHPQYSPDTLHDDIAMIFLDKPFKETSTFGSIQVADENVVDNQTCSIAGWGTTAKSIELLIANVSVVPREICNGAHSHDGKVGPHAFCAGSMHGGTDTCQGDSGGGITRQNRLVGVVSWGRGCGRKTFPGIYTNAYEYRDWIEKTIQLENVSPPITQSTVLMLATVFAAIFARSIF
ncbi:serine protease 1-like [Sitodiplosis mosellana]|uniref:serine protease 1-like n=1 Tax=Sitodiplosis mosellana TaxID=263140 RepID=UPI002444D41C|nr:serine protease 1-like [Sitodiplosis mosellana]